MVRNLSVKMGLLAAICIAASGPLACQITVEGVADQTVYTDLVSLRVRPAPGHVDAVALNGAPIDAAGFVEVAEPDYYELLVTRRETATGDESTLMLQFIVRSSERGNAEWGLSPWVPHPTIPSAAEELAGARLEIVLPGPFPLGLDIPVIALVKDGDGNRLGVNGAVRAGLFPDLSLVIRRGVGSGFLPAASVAGPIAYEAEMETLRASKEILIEPATAWIEVSGTIAATSSWGEDARIHVTGDLRVAQAATLSVGAGSVVMLAPGVDVSVEGKLVVQGTRERPVVFTPERKAAPWGGFIFRGSASRAEVTGAIFTGSGADPDWFDNTPDSGSSHRGEQCLLFLSNGARAELTDSYIIDLAGQAGHGEASFLTMTRCLVERCITAGQYNGGSVTLDRCALLEFPAADAPFEDNDNDALYLTGGSHSLKDTLIGWALDDGVDAGSGSAGPVTITGCWFESCYHEGMAWSEDRRPTVIDTVVLNCGQGIECGFGSPEVVVDHCLSTANLIGARFGDNYDWDYEGSLRVTGSLLLHNQRNVWGRAWDDWTEHISQMDIEGNFLGELDPNHPDNSLWDSAVHASMLEPFLPSPASVVGTGIALRGDRLDIAEVSRGVPVRLSTFTTRPVTVDYAIDSEAGPLGGGTLEFAPGETVEIIALDDLAIESRDLIRVTLSSPANARITGSAAVSFVRTTSVPLIAAESVWKYRAAATAAPATWHTLEFDDASWLMGPAELGFNEGDERTRIDGGPEDDRYRTIYFRRQFDVGDPTALEGIRIRLRRDDGAVVHLNGAEVFRSNMPEGDISHSTFASSSSTSETAFFTQDVDPGALVPGINIAAVEVHQASEDSSDLSFDLEVLGLSSPLSPGVWVRGDADGNGMVDISDPLRILFVLFAGAATDCEDALDADDDGNVAITDAIRILTYLFRGGPPPTEPFPEAGLDPTPDGLGCARG